MEGQGVSGHGIKLESRGGLAGLAVASCEGFSSHSPLILIFALNSHHYAVNDTTDETESSKRPPEPCEIFVCALIIRVLSAYAAPTVSATAIPITAARSSITGIGSSNIIVVRTTKHGVFSYLGGNSEEVSVFHFR